MKQNTTGRYLSERLIKRMDECFANGIASVQAPSGFGKSVCTDEYLRRRISAVSKVFWLTCEGLSPDELSDRLCDYVSQADPHAGKILKGMGYLTASNARQAGAVLQNIKSELPVWFVFDRIEALPETFRSCCAAFSKPNSENVHLVILTRDAPDIEAPAVTAADLTLTTEELAEMAGQAGLSLSDRELENIYTATSGWITAVALVFEYIHQLGAVPDTADTDTLIGALYDNLPREQRMALRRLCYFSRLTPAKVQFLLEEREISDNIREFFSAFPLIRFSSREDCWYIHDILTRYIISNSCDMLALARSAAWYCQTGAPERAVECYYSRLDYEGVLSVDFSRMDPDEIICGKPFIQIVRELARCPAELKLKYPLNMLRAAHLLFGEGDYAAYDGLMAEMEAIIRETGDERYYGEWLLESIFMVYPDLDAMTERVGMAAQRIDGRSHMIDPYSPFMFGSPSMWYCFHAAAGKAKSEAEKLDQFIAAYSELTGGHGLGADRLFRGEMLCARGETESAALLAAEAESIARVNGQLSVAVGAKFLQATAAYECLDSTRADEALRKLERLPSAYPYSRSPAAKRAVRVGMGITSAMLKKPVHAAGDIAPSGMGLSAMMTHLGEASRLIDEGKYQEVAGMLEAFLTMDERSCTTAFRQYVHLGLAGCYTRLGNVRKALSNVQTALDISVPDGCLMIFARSGAVLDKILTLAEPAYTDAVAKIADIRSRYMPDMAESLRRESVMSLDEKFRSLPEPLTDREIEIAKLAAEGMRNKEIAATLFLSERTVSNRLYTIFQKLNIDRRSELVDFLNK